MIISINDIIYEKYSKAVIKRFKDLNDDEKIHNFIQAELEKHLNTQLWLSCMPGYEFDKLTKTRTKANLEKYINEVINQEYDSFELSFLCFDIMDLRGYNDFHGLTAGDRYVQKVAEYIKRYFDEEKVFRVGGDEFVVDITGKDYLDVGQPKDIILKKALVNIKIKQTAVDPVKRSFSNSHIIPIIFAHIHQGILISQVEGLKVINFELIN